ncbi:DUF3883 domain-containing protein [Tahibacter sp.]|uniref:protein NO VEIN domain-containing protein n=1 Tax=Tahibacter sp. TaxID=2056211 RepID=UPI0028C37776|nr:DUF3883 domain-containing protein [Tahibacter sp.]
MTTFIAIKIHYDHRGDLPYFAKYSRAATKQENDEYLSLYESGIGGQGFHECLNFRIPTDYEKVRAYLPPTCMPKKSEEDLVVFSFTYKGDRERSSEVVGVHAGCRFLGRDGLPRPSYENARGVDPFWYHFEADPALTTLFSARLPYAAGDGEFTPAYSKWGYGLRNLKPLHAQSILNAALRGLNECGPASSPTEVYARERERAVLEKIRGAYFGSAASGMSKRNHGSPQSADHEIGYLGEKYVFEKEVEYVKTIGLSASSVEWTSQATPTAPFDIKTKRKDRSGTGYCDHFIEVKSMRSSETGRIFISSAQVDFSVKNHPNSVFVIVNFGSGVPESSSEMTSEQLLRYYALEPIKFEAIPKT